MTQLVYIGIDVSKTKLHVGSPEKFLKEFSNTQAGIEKLVDFLSQRAPALVALEATGGYERDACDAMHDAGLSVSVVQPMRVKHYAKSINMLAKTDRIDATVIAKFAEATNPQPTNRASTQVRKLRALCDRRQQLSEDKVREKGRLESCRDEQIEALICEQIDHLKRLIKQLDAQIAEVIKSDGEMSAKAKIIRQVIGIGPTVAATLLAHMPELGTLDRQQVAALAGLAPYARDSGNWRGKRSIYGGRAAVRRAMFMASLTAVRCCPVMSERYQILIAANKPEKVARIACARKMIVYVNTLLKNAASQLPPPSTNN